jgi:hypothetical protein
MQRTPERNRELMRQWRLKNPERSLEISRAWAAANPERKRDLRREWALAHPERVREHKRQSYLRNKTTYQRNGQLRRYGVTREAFDAMFAAQDGLCAICDAALDSSNRKLTPQVDHDHATGEFRGLLCGGCNAGLGQFKDEPAILQRASRYLYRAPLTLIKTETA